jgi:hypothetical protein
VAISLEKESSKDESPDEPYEWVIGATIIDGKAYPSYQFIVRPANSVCTESYLGPASDKFNTSYHVDFDEVGLTWVNGNCESFGYASNVEFVEEYPITDSQATSWEERFGTTLKELPYNP